MALLDIEVLRSKSSELIVQTLPDGSTAIFEVPTKNVYSLNPSAAAAWEACASCTTLPGIATAMSRRLNAPVTEDLAHEAVSELAAVGLVKLTPGEGLATSRRAMLRQVAGVAIPVVLVLTGAEQRAHAQGAGSPPVSTTNPGGGTTTTTTTTTQPPGLVCQSFRIAFVKGVDQPGGGTVALAGAVFRLFNPGGTEIATVTTDAMGNAEIILASIPLGTYRLVEDHLTAPGGPYAPFERDVVIDQSCQEWVRNLHNTPLPA
jgi:hypothetical protein